MNKQNETATINMFELATRQKLRFISTKGQLTIEQLWDVPLRSKDDFNLNEIAKNTNKLLDDVSIDFVDSNTNPAQSKLTMAMDIVKHVIDTKLGEEQAAERRARNRTEKEKLLKILAEKQEGKMSELSEKDLMKRIESLSES